MSLNLKTVVIDVVLAVIFFGGAYLLAVNERQNIFDWLALRDYHPPSLVVQLANQDTMTAYTRKVFYVNHPSIDPGNVFAGVCPNNSEQTVVLGCYHSGQQGIYLLSVTDSQLYGIEQVTAAYETLHAIYQRLSPAKQTQLNVWLMSFYNNGLNNPTVSAQIAQFKISEPTEVLNEMTSLFGTEISNLPSNLSQFYSHFFSSRQAILNYYSDYESAFTTRENQISSDDAQLASLKSEITAYESQLGSEQITINSQQATLNTDKSSGDISAYNAAVPGYNQLVHSYNSMVAELTSTVSQYNQIVSTRNNLALEEQQLVKAINSPRSIAND